MNVYTLLCLCIPPYVSFYFVFTDFLWSKALQERDDQIRRMREEATQAQKRFQKQQEEDRAQQAEVRERLEHLSLRKEELKQQLADKETELDEASRVHRQVFYVKVQETLLIQKLCGLLESFLFSFLIKKNTDFIHFEYILFFHFKNLFFALVKPLRSGRRRQTS